MSETTVIRSSEFSKELFLEKLKGLTVKSPAMPAAVAQPEPSFAPLTLGEIESKIADYRSALESDSLPDPIRKELDRRILDLVKQQYQLGPHDFIPDADGNNPAEVKAIVDAATETATKSVIATLTAVPESESSPLQSEIEPPDDEEDDEYDEEFDLDEQVEVLNEIDEADAVVVSEEPPTAIQTPKASLQLPQAVMLPAEPILLAPEVVSLLRASLRANLMHVVIKVLSIALQEK